MEKERNVAMNTKIEVEEPFALESKIEEVFMQKEHLQEIAKEIANKANFKNQVKINTPRELDAFGKEMEGYIVSDHYEMYL